VLLADACLRKSTATLFDFRKRPSNTSGGARVENCRRRTGPPVRIGAKPRRARAPRRYFRRDRATACEQPIKSPSRAMIRCSSRRRGDEFIVPSVSADLFFRLDPFPGYSLLSEHGREHRALRSPSLRLSRERRFGKPRCRISVRPELGAHAQLRQFSPTPEVHRVPRTMLRLRAVLTNRWTVLPPKSRG